MPTTHDCTTTETDELTEQEMRAMLDREARRVCGISGEEFTRKWFEGGFKENTDPQVTQVAMLLPDAW